MLPRYPVLELLLSSALLLTGSVFPRFNARYPTPIESSSSASTDDLVSFSQEQRKQVFSRSIQTDYHSDVEVDAKACVDSFRIASCSCSPAAVNTQLVLWKLNHHLEGAGCTTSLVINENRSQHHQQVNDTSYTRIKVFSTQTTYILDVDTCGTS